MKKTIGKMMVLACIIATTACSKQADTYEAKIDKLLKQMTLEEKIGQMNQLTGVGASSEMIGAIKAGSVGSILNEIDPNVVNELQRVAVEESRLGIPLIFARDVIHGFKTIFPIPLGQAASWNPQVAYSGARVAALEATSVGIRWTFAPMIDVSRDPRWGRIAESCGEDTYLTSVMGAAMVRGFQGDDLTNSTSMAACAKHFAAYGASEAGKDYNTTWIPEVQLRDVYLPPFKMAADAGAASFMCSFNDINGVPSSGSKFLNIDVLRKEWGYDGVLVSDWGSIEQMVPHGFSANLKQSAEQAANAGVDMDMMSYAYINHLTELVKSGEVSMNVIDECVRNILRLKYRLDLFDHPYVEVSSQSAFYKPEYLEAAKNAAIESAVLLKNDNILPLSKYKRVAVVGPLADAPADQVGTWCFDAEPQHSVTPLAAIKEQYGSQYVITSELGLTYSRDKNMAGITNAVTAARQSDIVLFFAGEEAVLSGEARCRADISLPGAQTEMLEALKATGKPVVMVVMAGRPLTIEKEVELADAVIYAFHGGTMAGPALADLIFGKAVPSGKLPVTLPRMVGQVPIYYNHKNTGRPASNMTMMDEIPVGALQTSIGFTSYHLDAGDAPLFPFGYGLSYTTFEYGKINLSQATIGTKDSLVITCNVKNTGATEASEVVQLYIRDHVGELIRPVKELKGFEKISLKQGESKQVKFVLYPDDLAYWHSDMTKSVDDGLFSVWVAPHSQSGEPVSFTFKN